MSSAKNFPSFFKYINFLLFPFTTFKYLFPEPREKINLFILSFFFFNLCTISDVLSLSSILKEPFSKLIGLQNAAHTLFVKSLTIFYIVLFSFFFFFFF